jgi:hypothetical protein
VARVLLIQLEKGNSSPGGDKMNKNIFLIIAATVIAGCVSIMVANAQAPKLDARFEDYRAAIKYNFQVDIKDFKEQLSGGSAAGKSITDYDLGQLLQGIKWEQEHTADRLLALELAMDHLESIPDYYTRLERMDWECRYEKLMEM